MLNCVDRRGAVRALSGAFPRATCRACARASSTATRWRASRAALDLGARDPPGRRRAEERRRRAAVDPRRRARGGVRRRVRRRRLRRRARRDRSRATRRRSARRSIPRRSARIRRRGCRNGCRRGASPVPEYAVTAIARRGARADVHRRMPDSRARRSRRRATAASRRAAEQAAAAAAFAPAIAASAATRAVADAPTPRTFAAATSRSSAGRTSASRRCSTRWSARRSASRRRRRRRRATASPASSPTTDAQFVFVDTPGFQTQASLAPQRPDEPRGDARASPTSTRWCSSSRRRASPTADRAVIALLPRGAPVVAALNKIDRVDGQGRAAAAAGRARGAASRSRRSCRCRAEKGTQLDALRAEIAQLLPESPPLYPADEITDRDERFLAAEFVREKIFRLLGDEVPYATTVGDRQLRAGGRAAPDPRDRLRRQGRASARSCWARAARR